jgi:hypothetical protein
MPSSIMSFVTGMFQMVTTSQRDCAHSQRESAEATRQMFCMVSQTFSATTTALIKSTELLNECCKKLQKPDPFWDFNLDVEPVAIQGAMQLVSQPDADGAVSGAEPSSSGDSAMSDGGARAGTPSSI